MEQESPHICAIHSVELSQVTGIKYSNRGCDLMDNEMAMDLNMNIEGDE